MLACPGRLDSDRGVAARGEDKYCIEILFDQVSPICEATLDTELLRACLQSPRRDVAQCAQLKQVVELADMREVHDLRDQTGTDNAGAEAIAAQRSAAVIGFRSYHRQGLANAAGPTSRHLGRAPYPPCPRFRSTAARAGRPGRRAH